MSKWTDNYMKEMELSKEYSTIPIKIAIYKHKEGWTGQVEDPNFKELSGCIVQGKSEEEIQKQILISIKCMLSFYEHDHQLLHKRAIWLSNWSKTQFWFRIIGIGLTLNWINSKYDYLKDYKIGGKYLGITKQGGLRIGKLLIFPQNSWKFKTKD